MTTDEKLIHLLEEIRDDLRTVTRILTDEEAHRNAGEIQLVMTGPHVQDAPDDASNHAARIGKQLAEDLKKELQASKQRSAEPEQTHFPHSDDWLIFNSRLIAVPENVQESTRRHFLAAFQEEMLDRALARRHAQRDQGADE